MKIRLVIILTLSLLLQSCLVRKEYKRPNNLPVDSLYRDNLSTDTSGIGSISYKVFFTDTTLLHYIEKGINNNIDMQIALQQLLIAKAYAKQGKAGYLPQLNINAQYSNGQLSQNYVSGFLSQVEEFNMNGMFSYELDVWGKIKSNKKGLLASYLQSQEATKVVKSDIVALIATNYYQLQALHEQLKIAKETLKIREESLQINIDLVTSGLQNQLVVDRAQSMLITNKSLITSLQSQIKIQENVICYLLGETSHPIDVNNIYHYNIDSSLSIGIPAYLLRNRPDIREAEYNLINAFELVNVARTNFYPKFTITASGGYQSTQLNNWFSPNSMFYNLIGSIAQPILNQRNIKTQYEVAKSNQEISVLNFKKSLLNAGKEVSDSYQNLKTSKHLLELKQEELESYENAINTSKDLFISGLANSLEVLNAQESALNARLDLVKLRLDELNYYTTLYKALGGGYK